MYAAAGGASLASRQARQRQRQQKKLQLQARLHPPKASALSVAEQGASTPTRQSSRQFHQLPTNYLRTPQAQARKLSASYTAQSKLLLPIDEGDTQSVLNMRMHSHGHAAHHSHSHAHHHQQQQQLQQNQQYHHHQNTSAGKHFHHTQFHGHSHGRISPRFGHRHSSSSGASFQQSYLPKSATATLPLVSQFEATPPTTPSGAAVAIKTAQTMPPTMTTTAKAFVDANVEAISLPQPHDAIIVTPATPMASPGHVAKLRDEDLTQAAAAERQPLTAGETADEDDEPMQPPTGPLKRKCSVYRMRRSDAFEQEVVVGAGSGVKRQLKELQFNNQQQQYEPLLMDEPQLLFKGIGNGRKWQICAYCEEGICVCEHIECAQGRAAWLERGRRCSVQEIQPQPTCSRRWVKRNRIQDASLGGSSDDEDFLGVLRGPSTFANAFLYVGLGTVALGLVIAFVGTGEKGFKTVELRLIGPSLIGLGLICCILRILFCICPSHCIASNKKARKKNINKVDADHTTSLLRGESKRVSIARAPSFQPKYPITHKRSQSKMLNEGMEALRQIATTSLFMQNEQKPSINRVVPIIKEPENGQEASLEMKKLDAGLNTDDAEKEDNIIEVKTTNSTIDTPEPDEATSKISNIASTASKKLTTTSAATSTATPTSTITSKNSSVNKKNVFSTAATTTAHAIPPPLGTVTNSVGKLTRQRVAFNQNEPPKKHQPLEQTQSLSSSSTVKESIDGDLLMETSLITITPVALTREARPPPSTTTTTANAVSCPLTMPPTTSLYTGAISRTPIATSTSGHTIYDLPPALPHTYAAASSYAAAAASCSRIGSTEREKLIRGPLGMTASPSAYTLPSSASTTPVTTPSVNTVTTSISLLPLAPSKETSITNKQQQQHTPMPGEVFDNKGPSTFALLRIASSIQSPLSQTSTTAISATSLPKSFTPISYKFPAPLSSTLDSSSSPSNGRVNAAPAMNLMTLAPPQTSPVNKFEPELLLSPAKLGQ